MGISEGVQNNAQEVDCDTVACAVADRTSAPAGSELGGSPPSSFALLPSPATITTIARVKAIRSAAAPTRLAVGAARVVLRFV